MAKNELKAEAWRSFLDDTIMIRIKEDCLTPDGQPYKKGIILKSTEEQFRITAEGQEYIRQVPKEIGRWDAVAEEAEESNEEEND